MRIRSTARFGAILCPSFDQVIPLLNQTIQQAQASGVPATNSVLVTAQNFYAQATGFWSDVAADVNCSSLTTQANQQIAALNAAIQGVNPSATVIDPATLPQAPPSHGLFSALGLPDWVAPVTYGTIGLIALAWIISSVAKFEKAKKAGA